MIKMINILNNDGDDGGFKHVDGAGCVGIKGGHEGDNCVHNGCDNYSH